MPVARKRRKMLLILCVVIGSLLFFPDSSSRPAPLPGERIEADEQQTFGRLHEVNVSGFDPAVDRPGGDACGAGRFLRRDRWDAPPTLRAPRENRSGRAGDKNLASLDGQLDCLRGLLRSHQPARPGIASDHALVLKCARPCYKAASNVKPLAFKRQTLNSAR